MIRIILNYVFSFYFFYYFYICVLAILFPFAPYIFEYNVVYYFKVSSPRTVVCITYQNCGNRKVFAIVILPIMDTFIFAHSFIIFLHFIIPHSQFSGISCICLFFCTRTPRIFIWLSGYSVHLIFSNSLCLNFQHPNHIASVLFLFNWSPEKFRKLFYNIKSLTNRHLLELWEYYHLLIVNISRSLFLLHMVIVSPWSEYIV